jgi:hypothetical protein
MARWSWLCPPTATTMEPVASVDTSLGVCGMHVTARVFLPWVRCPVHPSNCRLPGTTHENISGSHVAARSDRGSRQFPCRQTARCGKDQLLFRNVDSQVVDNGDGCEGQSFPIASVLRLLSHQPLLQAVVLFPMSLLSFLCLGSHSASFLW